jgi:urease subunit beta
MIPGEVIFQPGDVELNAGAPTHNIAVRLTGDRPVVVGSHCPFDTVNTALQFDRSAVRGQRLDIASGNSVTWDPGDTHTVTLINLRDTGLPP